MGVKGVLSTILAPAIGALADRHDSHALWLAISLSLLVFPYGAVVAASMLEGNANAPNVIWAYTVADALLGVYSVAMSLSFATVPASLNGNTNALTAGYSFCNFALSTGIGLGAVFGAFGDFLLCGWMGAVACLANCLAAVVFRPRGRAAAEDRGAPDCAEGPQSPFTAAQVAVLLRTNAAASTIAAVVFLDFLAEQMLVSLLLLYLGSQFHVSGFQLALQLGAVGGAASISLLFIVPKLQPLLGDLRLMRLGLAVNALSVGAFAFIRSPWQALLPPLGCLISFAVFPTANTLAAAALPRAQGGTAQGIVSGARTLAEAISPVLFGWLLQVASRGPWPGWPFLAAAGCVVVAYLATWRLSEPVATNRLLAREEMAAWP